MKRHGNSLCPYDCETSRPIFQGIILRVMILPLKPNNPEPPRTGQAMSWQVRWHPVNWSPMALENRCQQAP